MLGDTLFLCHMYVVQLCLLPCWQLLSTVVSFFNEGHFNSLELHFFVLDYLFIKLDFINDAVKLLKFCDAINCLTVKVRTLAFGM